MVPGMLDDEALTRMELTAYEAASGASRWNTFLEQLRRSFGATSAHLRVTPTPGGSPTSWWIESGVDLEAKSAYALHWGAQDPWALHPEGHQRSAAGRCFIGSDILPWRDLERTAFYNDFGRRAGLKGVMTALVEDGQGRVHAPHTKLALFRESALPEFEAGHLRAFAALQPGLRRALNSYWALQRLQIHGDAIERTLESLPSPVLVLRRDAGLEHANGAARLLQASGALKLVAGRLQGVAQVQGSRWLDLLTAAVAGVSQEVALWMAASEKINTATLLLSRLPSESPLLSSWPRAELLVVVQPNNALRAREAQLEAIGTRFRLTPVQHQVLKRMVGGETAEAIAAAHGVRVSTVRTHIRHLLDKTHTRRMLDLVRIVGE